MPAGTRQRSRISLCSPTRPLLPTVSPKRYQAPVAQLDRALPSEGRGHRFESCRVRQSTALVHCFQCIFWKSLERVPTIDPTQGAGFSSTFWGVPRRFSGGRSYPAHYLPSVCGRIWSAHDTLLLLELARCLHASILSRLSRCISAASTTARQACASADCISLLPAFHREDSPSRLPAMRSGQSQFSGMARAMVPGRIDHSIIPASKPPPAYCQARRCCSALVRACPTTP